MSRPGRTRFAALKYRSTEFRADSVTRLKGYRGIVAAPARRLLHGDDEETRALSSVAASDDKVRCAQPRSAAS